MLDLLGNFDTSCSISQLNCNSLRVVQWILANQNFTLPAAIVLGVITFVVAERRRTQDSITAIDDRLNELEQLTKNNSLQTERFRQLADENERVNRWAASQNVEELVERAKSAQRVIFTHTLHSGFEQKFARNTLAQLQSIIVAMGCDPALIAEMQDAAVQEIRSNVKYRTIDPSENGMWMSEDAKQNFYIEAAKIDAMGAVAREHAERFGVFSLNDALANLNLSKPQY